MRRLVVSSLFLMVGACAGNAASPVPETLSAGTGKVEMDCGFSEQGQLTDCRVLSETPAGLGFGQAALRDSRAARLSRGTMARAKADGRVRYTARPRLTD